MLYIILLFLTPALAADEEIMDYGLFGSTPRSDLDFIGMANYDGYSVEVHYVTTIDGYILTIFRIYKEGYPSNTTRNPIVLGHGLYLSSNLWIVPGANKSQPYYYVDKGYDVWLINVRGNTYGRNHTNLDPDKDSIFWAFDFIDMGRKDLPACIDYILKITGKTQVIYIGHSQGVTMALVLLSLDLPYNDKFQVVIGLSTTAYLYDADMPVLVFESLTAYPLEIFVTLGYNAEILKYRGVLQKTAEAACGVSELQYPLCLAVLYPLFGYNEKEITSEVIPDSVNHEPSGTSFRNFMLWGKVKDEGLRQKDCGAGNLEEYGQLKPSEFPMDQITAPFFFIQSKNDNVSTLKDMALLKSKFAPNVTGSCILSSEFFLHVDPVIGKHNIEYCAAPITDYLETGDFHCV